MDRMEPEVSRSLHHMQRISHYLRLPAAQKNRGNEPNVSQPAHHQQDRDSACNGNPLLNHS